MNLYLAIYVGIHVVGSAGPLPTNSTQCRFMADTLNTAVASAVQNGRDTNGTILTADQIEQAKTIRFRCEWRMARPEMGEPA